MIAGGSDLTGNAGKKVTYMGSGGGLAGTDGTFLDLAPPAGDVSYGMGGWFATVDFEGGITLHRSYVTLDAGGGVVVTEGVYAPTWHAYTGGVAHVRAGGKVFVPEGTELRIITGNDPNPEELVTGVDLSGEQQRLCASPSGAVLIAAWSGGIARKSTDGGNTWSALSAVDGFTVGFDVFANCGDDAQFVSGTVQKIMWTPDAGGSWVDKTGNLGDVAPMCSIERILVIGYGE